jgi:hypothetical protein
MLRSCFPPKSWIPGKASDRSESYARFELPRTEHVLAKFYCALQCGSFALSQGRLYVFPGHVAFGCKIPGQMQTVVIKLSDVSKVRKAKTLSLLPNAIEINKFDGTKYFFTSFLSRNDAFHLIQDLWFVSKGISSFGPPVDANRTRSDTDEKDDDSGTTCSELGSRLAQQYFSSYRPKTIATVTAIPTVTAYNVVAV